MFVTRMIPSGEVPLNLASTGSRGRPLLFLHGICRGWQDGMALMPALSLRWQLNALDFRGHGGSGRRPGHYYVSDHVRDTLGIVRAQFSEPVVIFGHSLGALVAAGVAAQEPGRVRALVLEDPPSAAFLRNLAQTPYLTIFRAMRELAGREEPVSAIARKLGEIEVPGAPGEPPLRLGALRDATVLRFMARCLRDVDPAVLDPVLERKWEDGYDGEAIAGQIRCPVLLLRGDEACGGMLPRADADAWCARVNDCTRIDLPGVGHLIHWQEPEKTAYLITGFLESL